MSFKKQKCLTMILYTKKSWEFILFVLFVTHTHKSINMESCISYQKLDRLGSPASQAAERQRYGELLRLVKTRSWCHGGMMIVDVKVTIRSRRGNDTQSIFKRHKFHSLHMTYTYYSRWFRCLEVSCEVPTNCELGRMTLAFSRPAPIPIEEIGNQVDEAHRHQSDTTSAYTERLPSEEILRVHLEIDVWWGLRGETRETPHRNLQELFTWEAA